MTAGYSLAATGVGHHRDLDCSICSEIADDADNNLFVDLFGPSVLGRYVVASSENFVALPSVGALVPGYLIVVPRAHVFSFLETPAEADGELIAFLAQLRRRLVSAFGGRVVTFEHGMASEHDRGGSCCDHAHLHLVPVGPQVEVVRRLVRRFPGSSFDNSQRPDRNTMAAPYLWCHDPKHGTVNTPAPRVESQFVRRGLAADLGMPDDWDWLMFPRAEEILRTMEVLGTTRHFEGPDRGGP